MRLYITFLNRKGPECNVIGKIYTSLKYRNRDWIVLKLKRVPVMAGITKKKAVHCEAGDLVKQPHV